MYKKDRFAAINEMVVDALGLKAMSEIDGRSMVAHSNSTKTGAGCIREICDLIERLDTESKFGKIIEANMAKQAIVEAVCIQAGFLPIQEMNRPNDVVAFMSAIQQLSQDFTNLIGEINKKMQNDCFSTEKNSNLFAKGRRLMESIYSVMLWAEKDSITEEQDLRKQKFAIERRLAEIEIKNRMVA